MKVKPTQWGMQYAVGTQYTVGVSAKRSNPTQCAVGISAKRSTGTVDLANMCGGDRYL